MTAANTMVAKTAAVLAALGLIASGFAFAPAASAQTATASATYTRDLTIGSTGADVTALQNFLISKGHAIAAGATGYFGAQTQAALAAYQAANGISPAAGYFGPMTRAKVSAGGSTGGTGTGTGSGSDNGDLSGGEANLTGYEFRSEDGSGDESEEGVEIATAEFEVEDADARVERLEVTFDASNGSLEDRPWQYFDTLYVMVDGDEVADLDASDRDEWDETTDDVYTVSFTGLDVVVDEGDTIELTIAADISGSIDTADQAQTFTVYVDDEGVRAVDGEGIQQYIGDDTDSVSFGFGAEDNGDLSVKASSEDPDASILVADENDESEDYTVFVFDIENDGDADSLVTDITIDVATGTATLANMVRSATLVVDGDEFDGDINYTAGTVGTIDFEDLDIEIAADEEVTFELMVSLKSNASAGTLTFSVDAADIDAEGAESGDEADIDGDIDGETHTVALTGIAVEAVSTSQSVTTPGDSSANTYATYTIKFDVTALEDDVYIDDVAASGTVSNGIDFASFGSSFAGTSTSILTSTADLVGSSTERFLVEEGETETFTLTVTLDPATAGTFGIMLEEVNFANDNVNGDTVFTVNSSSEDFRTDAVYVAN